MRLRSWPELVGTHGAKAALPCDVRVGRPLACMRMGGGKRKELPPSFRQGSRVSGRVRCKVAGPWSLLRRVTSPVWLVTWLSTTSSSC